MRGLSPRNSQTPAGCACAGVHASHTVRHRSCQALLCSVWLAPEGFPGEVVVPRPSGVMACSVTTLRRKGWSAAPHVGQATSALGFCKLVGYLIITRCPHLSWSCITQWTLNSKPSLATLLGVLTSLQVRFTSNGKSAICTALGAWMSTNWRVRCLGELKWFQELLEIKKLFRDVSDRFCSRC